jgi:hypothetical protein
LGRFNYRLDTNFAKIDRIQHQGLEQFKKRVMNTKIHNHTIKEWSKIVNDDTTNITDLLDDIL